MNKNQHSENKKHLPTKKGLIAKIVKIFTVSKLSPLLIIAALLAGVAALLLTPREEDPQIIVPVMDVMVDYPGASAEEVEKLVTTPLEMLLKQIVGVEYVYSASMPGKALVTVRYYVGEDREDSLVKTWSKLMSNQRIIVPGVTGWAVNPVDIDDVPIVLLTLSSMTQQSDEMALRRIADELLAKLRSVDDVAKSWVVGGARRKISIYPKPAALTARGVTLVDILHALGQTNINVQAGSMATANQEVQLEVGPYYSSLAEVGGTLVKSVHGRPVYLRDVASILDGPEDQQHYTRIGYGPAVKKMQRVGDAQDTAAQAGQERAMVTIAVAKRQGSNAVKVAEDVIQFVDSERGNIIPDDVFTNITRDYGETANHKVNELVKHLLLAIAIIVVLLAISLGLKESLIVSIAVPVTFAITLLFDLLFGYTINRVTLFALILSLGLLVDDPIVDVENIFRHFKLKLEPPLEALLSAVEEVMPPTIVATLAVIVAFLPMLFITGMMGPYMAPMAFNLPIAMLTSLMVAFTITPWASYLLLKSEYGKSEEAFDLRKTAVYRFYNKTLGYLIASPRRSWIFLLLVFIAFVASALLVVTRAVPLKLLPFDNKNEFQIVIDMPRNNTLERTDEVARAVGQYLATVNEVTDYESYIGLASPMDFNGMVRHYYMRESNYVGDIRVNLVPKEERQQQSHQIALRIRSAIEGIAKRYGANLKIVELPPGPPVLSTVVAEVYGPADAGYDEIISVSKDIRKRFEATAGMVDIDDFSTAYQEKRLFRLDREKAALTGVSIKQVAEIIAIALRGERAGALHIPSERLPLNINLQLPRKLRSTSAELLSLRVKSRSGKLVPLSELGALISEPAEQTIYHKNLRRLAYVTGETVGRSPVEAILDLFADMDERPLPQGYTAELGGEGEWKITVDVFRDLGIAFAAALLMIYVILVVQTGSLSLPVVMMIAIPLTIIGIMPGFWLLNVFFTEPIAGYADQIFFTATAMIGMIALAGIVVRNGIILIDFIERTWRSDPKMTLTDALVIAGSTRLRPIFLTAGAAMFGSVVIILDPIFSGLAWSFIFGIFASTGFSLFVIPVVYFLLYRGLEKPVCEESSS